jgi:2,3-diaminopropionate biosynthesis protein SbnB
MIKKFSIITSGIIKEILDSSHIDVYNIIRDTYLKFGNNEAINPPSYFLKFPDKPSSRIIALPALIKQDPRIAGIKWISSNPENLNLGLKRASAVIILNDYETGYPIACLEGAIISSRRTVISAILAAELLKKNHTNLGLIGAGNIAKEFVDSVIPRNWNLNSINIFDKNPYASVQLKNHINNLQPSFNPHCSDSLEDAIKKSDIIFLSTTSSSPYINDISLFKHNPVLLNISLRDLDPEIIINSNNVVDDIDHVLAANTSVHLTQQKYNTKNFINCNIAELINGYKNFSENKPIIFSPMGMGILDLALSIFVLKNAIITKKDIDIENFFDDSN